MQSFALVAGAVAATPIPSSVGSGAGRLMGITVTATGAGTTTIYDNSTTNSGTVLATVAGTGTNAIGSYLWFGPTTGFQGLPYNNGITINQAASSPGVTVFYSPSCPNDGRPAT